MEENAANALLIAGGVLIGVLLLTLAVYLFIDFGSTSANINKQNAQKQITQFNAQFTSYEDTVEGKTWTIYDIITVAGLAKQNNDYYADSDSVVDKVTVKIQDKDITNYTDAEKQELIKNDQNEITSESNRLPTYKCFIDGYHEENGKVKGITFKKNN